jgi:hypothetical protein
MEASVAASEPMKPFQAEDGKEYYVMYVPAWVMEDFREALNPWPEIYRSARLRLQKISA